MILLLEKDGTGGGGGGNDDEHVDVHIFLLSWPYVIIFFVIILPATLSTSTFSSPPTCSSSFPKLFCYVSLNE